MVNHRGFPWLTALVQRLHPNANPTGYVPKAVPKPPGMSSWSSSSARSGAQPSGNAESEEEALRRAIEASLADVQPPQPNPYDQPQHVPQQSYVAQQPQQHLYPQQQPPAAAANVPAAAPVASNQELAPVTAAAGWAGLQDQLQVHFSRV